MTPLIPGQNIQISGDCAYRLELSLPGWSWGVIASKRNAKSNHLEQEEGVAITNNQLLINIHDISDDLEKLVEYTNGFVNQTKAMITTAFEEQQSQLKDFMENNKLKAIENI